MVAENNKARRDQQEQTRGKGRALTEARSAGRGPDAEQRRRGADEPVQGEGPYFRQARQRQQTMQAQQQPVHERRQGRAVNGGRQPLAGVQRMPEGLTENAFQRQIKAACPEGRPEEQTAQQQERQRPALGKGREQGLRRTRLGQRGVRPRGRFLCWRVVFRCAVFRQGAFRCRVGVGHGVLRGAGRFSRGRRFAAVRCNLFRFPGLRDGRGEVLRRVRRDVLCHVRSPGRRSGSGGCGSRRGCIGCPGHG